MQFHIPFTFSPIETLKKRAAFVKVPIKVKKDSGLAKNLANSDVDLTQEEYLAICIRSFMMSFVYLYIFSTTLLVIVKATAPFLLGLGLTVLLSIFVFFIQIMYPKTYVNRKERDIDRNLIAALSDIHVQLNSGIPLFSILVNISSSDYGALSIEFKKAVKKINAGYPEVEVLEELGERNTSPFFRRTLWQISNGMKAGSDVSIVIKEGIKLLSEEQVLQLQNYGNKLNPLIMFYMLISVILPALAVTFLTVIASLVGLSKSTTTLIFVCMFIFVIFLQFMFIGTIKSIRPSLL